MMIFTFHLNDDKLHPNFSAYDLTICVVIGNRDYDAASCCQSLEPFHTFFPPLFEKLGYSLEVMEVEHIKSLKITSGFVCLQV